MRTIEPPPSPHDFHPDLTPERLKRLSEIIAQERDSTIELGRLRGDPWWGLACLAYDRVRARIAIESDTIDWLDYVPETGNAYTVKIGSVPVRVQREGGEGKPVLGGEAGALSEMRGQLEIDFKDGFRERRLKRAILRLEFEAPNRKVERVALKLLDPDLGSVIQAWPILDRTEGLPSGALVDIPLPAADELAPANFQLHDDEAGEAETDEPGGV